MERHEAFAVVMAELCRAEKIYPAWPDDPVLAAAVVGEEAGELLQSANNSRWHGGDHAAMRTEAIQTAAMAIRFLIHEYKTFEKI
jgi:hypothetical protein